MKIEADQVKSSETARILSQRKPEMVSILATVCLFFQRGFEYSVIMISRVKSFAGAAFLTFLILGWSHVCHAQTAPAFNSYAAYQLDTIPTTGTFFSIQGDYPPLPFDPFPLLPLYYDGTPGSYWFDDVTFNRMATMNSFMAADEVPGPPSGGTNDSGSYSSPSYSIPSYTLTTNESQYTNFWLTIGCSPTNSLLGLVDVVSTLPGYYYAVLTNADPNKTGTNWNVWTTVLAVSSNTPAPPIDLSLTNLNFRGAVHQK
jgi:hypothetical protein